MRHTVARLIGCFAIIGTIAAFPAITSAQAAATICKDGTTSAAKGRGACGQHGGVDAAATKSAKVAARAAKRAAKAADKVADKSEKAAAAPKATASAGAAVNCTDGTTGTAGRGACSHHGGIAGASSTAPAAQPATGAIPSPRASTRAAARSSAGAARAEASSGAKEDNDPAGALAQCKDGMYSHSANRRGACGHHGGVKQWMHS